MRFPLLSAVAWSLACLVSAAALGCSDSIGGDPAGESVVCTQCRAGGETSDFGTPAPCNPFMVIREVDRAEAESLGFEVHDYERLIERPLDVEMTWLPQETQGGGPASGYEASTRLSVALEVDRFDYAEFDPELCEGTTWCMPDADAGADAFVCEPYLYVFAHGELETADGAVRAKLDQQVVRIMSPDRIVRADGNWADSVAALVDFSVVRGTLQIDPAIPEPYGGFIYLSLQYTPARELEYAVVSVEVAPDWDARGPYAERVPSELARYNPLEGVAGTLPWP